METTKKPLQAPAGEERRTMSHDRVLGILGLLSLACLIVACKREPRPSEPYQHAVVALTGDKLTVGGRSIAVGDMAPDKPALANNLLRVLRDNRERWKQSHPDVRFDGSAELTVRGDLSCQTVKNLWVTVSRAGYPRVVLRQGSDSVEFDVYLPGPPPPNDKPPEKPPVRLRLRADGSVAVQDTCDAAPEILGTNRVAARVWSHEGELRDLILIACDPGASAVDLLAVLTHVRTHAPFRVSSNICPMGDTIYYDIAEARAYALPVAIEFVKPSERR